MDSSFCEESNTFFEVKFDYWLNAHEVLEWILCLDDVQLFLEPRLEAVENVNKKIRESV